MVGDRARTALRGTRFSDVRWVEWTGSTNDDASALAADGAAEGIVVVADHQSAGRGRLHRAWTAPPGSSLLASVLLRPPAMVAASVTMAASVAMRDAIAEVAGIDARLKWPNDLVWPGDGSRPDRKLAGILAEAEWPARSNIAAGWLQPPPGVRVAVVVGTGVNVNWPAIPSELIDTATSLNHLVGRRIDREQLLTQYLLTLDTLYTALTLESDGDAIAERWRRASATLGRSVQVDLGSEHFRGTAVDLTTDGRLVVESEDGVRRTFSTGDVVHLRPAP